MGAALQQGDLGRILLGSEASGITSLLTVTVRKNVLSIFITVEFCCVYRKSGCAAHIDSHTLGVVVRGPWSADRGTCVNFRFP